MKNSITLSILTILLFANASGVFAYGNDQTLTNNQIIAAAASNKTVVEIKNTNQNLNANSNKTNVETGDVTNTSKSYAQGGDSKSNSASVSGSKSNSHTGDNNINIEGDKIPSSSAIAGNASICVNALAVQGSQAGFSLGGISAECQASIAADIFFDLAEKFKAADPEVAQAYLKLGHKYARKSAPGVIQMAIKDTSETMIDLGVILTIAKFAIIPLL